MPLNNMPLADFCDLTASDSPAPGGGSISALSGALSAALTQMVAGLSIDKAESFSQREKLQNAAEKAASVREALVKAIDTDADAFDQVMKAYRLPKNNDAEKDLRRAVIREAMKNAAMVPLGVAEHAAEVFPLAELMIREGNPNALTDAMVAVLCAETAVLGASVNVRINLKSIKDEAFVEVLAHKVEQLESNARENRERLWSLGLARLAN